MSEYTKDYLLDKQVQIFQPINGYRASTDAVMLSSAVSKVKKGDTILDVGSGTGAVSLCLASRFYDAKPQITGLEIQSELAELSNMSAEANGFADFLHYINCDIRNKPREIENCSFAHVITNPPYAEKDMPSPNAGKATAHNHNGFSLKGWIEFCIKMIKPKGWFYIVNRAEAVSEILSVIHGKLGHIEIIPLYSKNGQKAKRVIIRAQKDNHAATVIMPPLIIHASDGNYTEKAQKILRLGNGLDEV